MAKYKDPFDWVGDTMSGRSKGGRDAYLDDGGDTDYSAMLKQMIESGSNPAAVQQTLDSRTKKALSGDQTKQYAYDDVYQAAMDYVNQKKGAAGKPSGYDSPYGSQIDDLLDQILNRKDFSYDHEKDPVYQQYKESYTRDGQKAMQDTLGQVSMRTGGLASSYAGSAAQQTYDGYMGELNDKIPELYQAAYDKYMGEIDAQVRDLGLLNQMDANQYGRYRDSVGDWRDDRDFAYGVGRDQIADERYEDEWNYGVGRDQIGDERYKDETGYNRAYQANRDAYNDAMDRWQITGTLDEAGSKVLGIPAGTKTSDERYRTAQQARASSGGGVKESAYKPRLSAAQAKSAVESGGRSESVLADYEYWFGEQYQEQYGTKNAASTGDYNRYIETIKGYRTDDGRVDKVERLLSDEKISEAQAAEILKYFKISLE